MTLPPLSLYIHVPWCIRKCPYCDFNSHKAGSDLPEEAYIQALLADLDADLHWVQERPVETLFFGGGTPSLLSADAYRTLFAGLRQRLDIAVDAEITLEANPGTFEADKFAAYREVGINRLSIGIQSFQNPQLTALGRVHDAGQAERAVAMAKAAGFDNFNLDLMHGLPGQTPELALADLQTALSFEPPHLSWYQLTIEPNTEFWSKPPTLPEDDTLWDIQEAGARLLASHGLEQYEVSAFSRPGQQARHNLNYWQFGDYLGIGAGAHGKITQGATIADGQAELNVMRTRKTRLPKDYLNPDKRFLAATETIHGEDLGMECLMNALRLKQGIDIESFMHRTGLSPDRIAGPIHEGITKGLLETGDRLKASAKGQLFLNELLALFLTD